MVRNRTFYIEIRISLKKIRFLTTFEATVYSETPGTSNACGPTVLAVGAGGGGLDIFFSRLSFLFFLPLSRRRPNID